MAIASIQRKKGRILVIQEERFRLLDDVGPSYITSQIIHPNGGEEVNA